MITVKWGQLPQCALARHHFWRADIFVIILIFKWRVVTAAEVFFISKPTFFKRFLSIFFEIWIDKHELFNYSNKIFLRNKKKLWLNFLLLKKILMKTKIMIVKQGIRLKKERPKHSSCIINRNLHLDCTSDRTHRCPQGLFPTLLCRSSSCTCCTWSHLNTMYIVQLSTWITLRAKTSIAKIN